ncbi:MAG: sigma 54-interacting transcriptional regulator [Sandaracinaceae bacterium]
MILDLLTDPSPLPQRLDAARERGDMIGVAILAALLCRRQEAAAAMHSASSESASRERDSTTPVAAALVALWAGDPMRGLVAAERRAGDAMADALAAEALALTDRVDQALERLAPIADDHPYARAVRAWIHRRRGEAARALAALEGASEAGLLGARVRRLRAEALLAGDPPDATAARHELCAGVWRLVQLGAPDELGRAYLAMAEVEASTPEGGARAAQWLARAHPLLQSSGTRFDQERLRRAFRRFGRRAIDRLVDEDLERCLEGVRAGSSRALDLSRAAAEQRADGADPSEVERELVDALEETRDRQEQLIGSLEAALVDKERTGQLVEVVRALFLLSTVEQLDGELPRLALRLGGATASLLRAGEAGFETLTRTSERAPGARGIEPALRDALRVGAARIVGTEERKLALIPIRFAEGDRVVVLLRSASRAAHPQGSAERLSVLGSAASAAYERARSARAVEEAAARDAATLEAIREGILTLDARGVVQAANGAAASLVGLSQDDIQGQRLRELRGLGALAEAVERAVEDETVALPHVDVLVRARRYAGGVVATLQELGKARQRALELVGSAARFTFDDLVGRHPAFLDAVADARRVAAVDVPVLITGESGTGKELLAQAIHNASPRANHPFVGVNVAAIPRELLESELFGYERGAFTGARARGHAGRFELADQGTLLLDEIGDMPYEMQAKLLRVLQERTVTRLGGTRAIPVRARVVATTHRDLEEAIRQGTFRLDLFYRLRVVHLRLPALRERASDVRLLIDHHLARWASRNGRAPLTVEPRVMERLEQYAWPGNVRELANLVEGVASLLPSDATRITKMPTLLGRARGSSAPAPDPEAGGDDILPLADLEKRALQRALSACDGNIAQAARALGIARGTFYNKMNRYGLR